MLYSEKNNFVFIHIPKAAGTSVIVYLKKIIPDLECVGRHHNTVGDIATQELQSHCPCGLVNNKRTNIPSISIETTRFLAIIRDPVEIWQSHFNWGIQKTGLYKQTRYTSIYNAIFKIKGSAKTAFTDFNDFLVNGQHRISKSNRFFKGHLNLSLDERLTLNGVFPTKLFLIQSNDVNKDLPVFTKQILNIPSELNLEHKNRAKYQKLNVDAPPFLQTKEKWYYQHGFNKYLFNSQSFTN